MVNGRLGQVGQAGQVGQNVHHVLTKNPHYKELKHEPVRVKIQHLGTALEPR